MGRRILSLLVGLLSVSIYAADVDSSQFMPPPMVAVARTPYTIRFPKVMDIQSDLGYRAGLSGFVDASSGNIGFPVAGRTALCFSYDKDALILIVQMGYPYGRNLKKASVDSKGSLEEDDTFELLLEPRAAGKGKGRIYRFIGNAAGVISTDVDLSAVGQFHQNWGEGVVSYITMMWDPSRSFMGAIHIPFSALGGAPEDGEIWGVQCALKYKSPEVRGLISATTELTDVTRFAQVRFDHKRNLNFAPAPMDSLKGLDFVLDGVFTNNSEKEGSASIEIELLKNDTRFDFLEKTFTIAALKKYSPIERINIRSRVSTEANKNTVAIVRCIDKQGGATIYEQSLRYWKEDVPSERRIKELMAKDFSINVGPYPSAGSFDYLVDTKTLQEMNPDAESLLLSLRLNGNEMTSLKKTLEPTGVLKGVLRASKERAALPEGKYELHAKILSKDGSVISERIESYDRKVFPFESYTPDETSERLPEPFTKPEVKGMNFSCVLREYIHGKDALLRQIVAGGEELFSAPVQFWVDDGAGKLTALSGGVPTLSAGANATAQSTQTFEGAGLKLSVKGFFDYDGFYKFTCELAPASSPRQISKLLLRIPLKNERAYLIDIPNDLSGWDLSKAKNTGLIDSKASGRIADSLMFTYQKKERVGNMPPFVWVGDDERGLCFSMASEKGCSNDPKLPALTIDREAGSTIIGVSVVNKPLMLSAARQFEFALQASPFKSYPPTARRWRGVPKDDFRFASYKHDGLFLCNYQNTGATYPTYGRVLDLEAAKAGASEVRKRYSTVQVAASARSECAGTPEYKTFWREWGSPMGFDKINLPTAPEPVQKMFKTANVPFDGYVMVEAISNTSDSNLRYRLWWFDQCVKAFGADYVYQDNSPYNYYDTPEAGLGYVRDDGVEDLESVIWQNRLFMKRTKEIATKAGKSRPSGVWANIMDAPIRSFCDTGIIGECPESDKLPIELFRVWYSKQWGMHVSWLFQTPLYSDGAPRRYWRTLCAKLFLHDATDFIRSEEAYGAWLIALDVLDLGDATLAWHPYYKNSTIKTAHPETLVSSYTANGKALMVVSNQNTKSDVIEELTPMPSLGQLSHYYDAETGEDITVKDGKLRLFVPSNDYRLVLGLNKPYPFAATRLFEGKAIPPQSELDARKTLSAICTQLLSSTQITPIPNGHRLTEEWVSSIIDEGMSSTDSKFMDEKQCQSIDIGAAQIKKSIINNPKGKYGIVVYVNPTDKPVRLNGSVRAAFGLGEPGYVLNALTGIADGKLIDLEPGEGKIEVIYHNSTDYWKGPRRGPLHVGTQESNMLEASLEAHKD